MSRRGKSVALCSAAAGLVVLVGTAIAAKSWIVEEWYIRRLERGSLDEQVAAAERLAELRSVRAVPALLGALRTELRRRCSSLPVNSMGMVSFIGDPDNLLGERGVRIRKALVKIGKPATLDLLKDLRDEPDSVIDSLADSEVSTALMEIYDAHGPLPPEDRLTSAAEILLRKLRDDPAQAPQVRQVSAQVLEKRYSR